MKCPFCGGDDDRVIDSRACGEGEAIRRRRECQLCRRRYTTYERLEEVPRLVLKKDSGREPFSRPKLLQGLLKACEKRPVPYARLEQLADLVEKKINEEFDYEVESRFIGQTVIEELKKIDQVAYVRFASVYREFADVTEFIRELTPLIRESQGKGNGSDGSTADRDRDRSSEAVEGERLKGESNVGNDAAESPALTVENGSGDQASTDTG